MSTETDTEKDRMHALALRTVERIEEEARAIRLLEKHEGTTWDEFDADDEDDRRTAHQLREARETLELDPPNGEEPTDDVAEGLEEKKDSMRFEGPLAISRHGVNHGEGWETTEVVIVLGTGGPHVQVEYRGDRATVSAWGWFMEGKTDLPVDADAVNVLYGVDSLYHDELD